MTRRLPPRRRRLARRQWTLSVAFGLAVIGFIGAAQWNSSLARQQFVTSAQRVLVGEAEQLQRQQETLRTEVEAANERVQTFQRADAGSQAALQQLNERLDAARLATGLVEVVGPGVVIEIADSLRPPDEGQSPNNYLVLADDLRDIVVALWGAGAEGIAISGGAAAGVPPERVVATTSIYGAGNAIVVNTAYLSPPYRIEAVGPDGLHERFLTHPAYLARVEPRVTAFGLEFASEARDEVQLPAFIGDTRLRWGAPVADGD